MAAYRTNSLQNLVLMWRLHDAIIAKLYHYSKHLDLADPLRCGPLVYYGHSHYALNASIIGKVALAPEMRPLIIRNADTTLGMPTSNTIPDCVGILSF